jgi:hypothetical protein
VSPLICYEDKRFSAERMAVIALANKIITKYADQGYDLTLRQLYYQFVSLDAIPNRMREYKRLGDIVSEGRRAGLIDWDAITDRTRNLESLPFWAGPQNIVDGAAAQFRFDRWARQSVYVEVWFEKDALEGVFERICNELRVPFFSCRGYTSDSSVWRAAQRLNERWDEGKEVVVLHFGDHDPSGLDMTRDIEARLRLFEAGDFEVRRLALNNDQIRRYRPPPNPAKESDSRFRNYRAQYGDKSWELDALEPTVLARLVRDEVASLVDEDIWKEDIDRENTVRGELALISSNYTDVVKHVAKLEKRR